MKVGIAYKCPQRSATKVLVHKSFELCGFCTWPSFAVWQDKAKLLGEMFSQKHEIRRFSIVKVVLASKSPQMITTKVLVDKSFELCMFCTWPSLAVWHNIARYSLMQSFMKK